MIKIKKRAKNLIKKLIRYPVAPEKFFQYWYRPKKLKRFIENSGLKVVHSKGADLLYVFSEMNGFSGNNLQKNPLPTFSPI